MKSTILAGLGACLFALPAFAHATLEVQQAPAGTTYKAVMRVTHGCNGAPTHTVTIDLPEGMFGVKPMPKPGWNIELVPGDYANTYDNHGRAEKSGVRRIIWSGGNLPDNYFDEFTFRGSLSKDLAPGTVLTFPTVQTCTEGSNDWVEIQQEGQERPRHPAPILKITAPGAAAH